MAGSETWRNTEGDFPLGNEPAFRGDPYSLPIPNAALRAASSISDLGFWYAIGEAWAQIAVRFLPRDPAVLDIGCGCGKIARHLYMVPGAQYIGVDLFLPAILWCRTAFKELAGSRFLFEHFDGVSEVYNPSGTIKPSEYRLPVKDQSIDMTVCASLFTHLREPDLLHYLSEIHRVLKDDGRALVSIHDEPPAGSRFAGDEARIDIDQEYFLELAASRGLMCSRFIGNVYGQKVFLLESSRSRRT